MRPIATFVALMSMAGIAVGCGSESEEPLTKAAFIKQADAICAKNDKQLQADFAAYVKKGTSSSATPNERSAEITTAILIPSVGAEIEELDELAAPEGDEDQVAAMLEATEEGLEKAEAEPEKALGENPFVEGKGLAKRYGLKICGES